MTPSQGTPSFCGERSGDEVSAVVGEGINEQKYGLLSVMQLNEI